MRSVLLLLLAATPLAYGDSFQLFQNVFGRRALPLAQQVEQKLLGSNKWTPPPFCHGLECPRYEVGAWRVLQAACQAALLAVA